GRDPALVAELDAWLRAREADGTLAALRARWLGPERARARSAFASDLDALVALVDLPLAFIPAVPAAKAKTGRSAHAVGQEAADPGALATLDPGRVAEALDGSLTPATHRRAIASAIAHLTASPITRREKTGVCQRRITSLEAGRPRPLIADPDEKSRANPETSAVSVS